MLVRWMCCSNARVAEQSFSLGQCTRTMAGTRQSDAVFLFATLVPAEMKRAKGKITEWTLHPLSVGAQRDDPKATCEWKVTATTPRRRQFGPRLLYDHRRAASGAKLGRRKQESNFLVTINPNKRRSPDLNSQGHCRYWRCDSVCRAPRLQRAPSSQLTQVWTSVHGLPQGQV